MKLLLIKIKENGNTISNNNNNEDYAYQNYGRWNSSEDNDDIANDSSYHDYH